MYTETQLEYIAQQWRLYLLQKFGVDLLLGVDDAAFMQIDMAKVRSMTWDDSK